MDTIQQQPEEEGKTGVIPNEQLAGSDADKAYDQDGNFPKQTPTEGEPDTSSKGMGGSDTRGEDSAADNPNQTALPTDEPIERKNKDDDEQNHVET